ncbi:PREDICTED: acidic mammalian chitinase-like, partial [Rhagoletis zephyria]|uniref:acidic mammalian chitinase-like n=1 Tax=Rhagoletis zephyria TaxID=28612 RepID=UPI0008114291
VVDFVNLQSYDFHSYRADRPYTGHHSPLYPRSTDQAYFSTLNVAWAATYWANSGMPLRKIMVGVPTYARTYNLVVPIGQNQMNAPASGPGLGRGKLNYSSVCAFLRLPGAAKQFDVYSQVPYAYRAYDWVAYENEMSVAIKAQWVVKTGMGGVVTFALNFDDAGGEWK